MYGRDLRWHHRHSLQSCRIIQYRASSRKWPLKEALQTHSTSACILWEPEDAWRKGERELLFQTLQQHPGLQIIPEIRASNPETLQNLSKKLHMKPGP